jgi:hypothetical protein
MSTRPPYLRPAPSLVSVLESGEEAGARDPNLTTDRVGRDAVRPEPPPDGLRRVLVGREQNRGDVHTRQHFVGIREARTVGGTLGADYVRLLVASRYLRNCARRFRLNLEASHSGDLRE